MTAFRGRRANVALLCLLVCLAAFIVFAPLLKQPPILDDVDILTTLSSKKSPIDLAAFRLLAHRCLLPDFFRPLAAPLFWLLNCLLGQRELLWRTATLVVDLLSVLMVGWAGSALAGDAATGVLVGLIYLSSWLHWDFLVTAANLPQAVAHGLFWYSLALFVTGGPNWKISDAVKAMAPVTMALFLKEDVIIFPAFVLSICFWRPHLRKKLSGLTLIFFSWVASYVGLRVLMPDSFSGSGAYLSFHPAGVFKISNYVDAYHWLEEQWLSLLPSTISCEGWLRFYHSKTGNACLWLLAVIGLGAAIGQFAWSCTKEIPGRSRRQDGAWGQIIVLAMVGSLAGISAYAAFGAVQPWNMHRFALSWGALSIGLGAGAAWVRRRKIAKNWMFVVLGVVLSVRTAISCRYPDPHLPYFARLSLLYEAREFDSAVTADIKSRAIPADEFDLQGFPPIERAPQRLQLLLGRPADIQEVSSDANAQARERGRGRRWLIRRTISAGAAQLDMVRSPDKIRATRRWHLEPTL